MNKIYYFIVLSLFFGCLTSCYKVEKGYNTEKDTLQEIQEMVKNNEEKNEFIFKFGSPTFTNPPDNDIICYVKSDGKVVAFNRFYKPTYLSICIKFVDNKAKEIQLKNISNLKKQKMTDFKIDFKKPL